MDSKTWPLTCNVWGWKTRSSKTRPSQVVAWWSGRTPGDSRTGTAPHQGQTPAERKPRNVSGQIENQQISISLISNSNWKTFFLSSLNYFLFCLSALLACSLSLSLSLSLIHMMPPSMSRTGILTKDKQTSNTFLLKNIYLFIYLDFINSLSLSLSLSLSCFLPVLHK